MPFVFIILGIMLTTSGARGKSDDLAKLVKDDLSGQHSYLYWSVSIILLGSLGYVETLRPLSRSFMVLVLVSLVLSNRGFFSQFQKSLSEITSNVSGS